MTARAMFSKALLGKLLFAAGLAAAALVAPLQAGAATPALQGTATIITSNEERMISLRHQDRMWQTFDGGVHLMVNRGTMAGADQALMIYSTYDSGKVWMEQLQLSGTDGTSTVDAALDGTDLRLVYSTSSGEVRYSRLRYFPGTRSWLVSSSETAFSSPDHEAIGPALTVDTLGRVWCGFAVKSRDSGLYSLRMFVRDPIKAQWVDSKQAFGTEGVGDSVTNDAGITVEGSGRSIRPIALKGGTIAAVYTEHENVYWATRALGRGSDAEWTPSLLFTGNPADKDPYASHFSVAMDAAGIVHFATVDLGKPKYWRFNPGAGKWTGPVPLTADSVNAAYVQVTIASSNVMVLSNVADSLLVYQSSDSGLHFTPTHQLLHDNVDAGVIDALKPFGHPRVESPSQTLGPVVVMQQYRTGPVQTPFNYRLMTFPVPIVTVTP